MACKEFGIAKKTTIKRISSGNSFTLSELLEEIGSNGGLPRIVAGLPVSEYLKFFVTQKILKYESTTGTYIPIAQIN